ncbi:hypothetical protein H696_00199 [Fonticula alba]|uniref:S1 motif domain-containing protein n=1 Tax=Fonticula alba TaxID=691883 RepID=A0A058ZDY9_FONAL|nr:hypothetical protein H696_00199 [Fonticula alba]KCV72615.1 hypothetical protein H696_00199 [Fonticula alba]|eukprot:XP_009492316.1 hypothetical protein H696_00199 [Fonticula alba]
MTNDAPPPRAAVRRSQPRIRVTTSDDLEDYDLPDAAPVPNPRPVVRHDPPAPADTHRRRSPSPGPGPGQWRARSRSPPPGPRSRSPHAGPRGRSPVGRGPRDRSPHPGLRGRSPPPGFRHRSRSPGFRGGSPPPVHRRRSRSPPGPWHQGPEPHRHRRPSPDGRPDHRHRGRSRSPPAHHRPGAGPPPRRPAPGILPAVGQIIRGTVKSLHPFGAFVHLPAPHSMDGLVHIGQIMSTGARLGHPEEVLDVDSSVIVKVLEITFPEPEDQFHHSSGRRRPPQPKIGLSIKYVDQRTGEDLDPGNMLYNEQALGRSAGPRGGPTDSRRSGGAPPVDLADPFSSVLIRPGSLMPPGATTLDEETERQIQLLEREAQEKEQRSLERARVRAARRQERESRRNEQRALERGEWTDRNLALGAIHSSIDRCLERLERASGILK